MCSCFCQLINGDLTANFRHPGYQKMKNFSVVSRTVSDEAKESRWISEVMQVLSEVMTLQPLWPNSNNVNNAMDALRFLSELGSWRLVETTGDVRASSFLFQRISVVVQRFNSVLLHNGFIDVNRPEKCALPNIFVIYFCHF